MLWAKGKKQICSCHQRLCYFSWMVLPKCMDLVSFMMKQLKHNGTIFWILEDSHYQMTFHEFHESFLAHSQVILDLYCCHDFPNSKVKWIMHSNDLLCGNIWRLMKKIIFAVLKNILNILTNCYISHLSDEKIKTTNIQASPLYFRYFYWIVKCVCKNDYVSITWISCEETTIHSTEPTIRYYSLQCPQNGHFYN